MEKLLMELVNDWEISFLLTWASYCYYYYSGVIFSWNYFVDDFDYYHRNCYYLDLFFRYCCCCSVEMMFFLFHRRDVKQKSLEVVNFYQMLSLAVLLVVD